MIRLNEPSGGRAQAFKRRRVLPQHVTQGWWDGSDACVRPPTCIFTWHDMPDRSNPLHDTLPTLTNDHGQRCRIAAWCRLDRRLQPWRYANSSAALAAQLASHPWERKPCSACRMLSSSACSGNARSKWRS